MAEAISFDSSGLSIQFARSIREKIKYRETIQGATTIIEFLLIYSSKMTFEANGT